MEQLETRLEKPDLLETNGFVRNLRRQATNMISDAIAFGSMNTPIYFPYELLRGRDFNEVVKSRTAMIALVYPAVGPMFAGVRGGLYKLFGVEKENSLRKKAADWTAMMTVALPFYGAILMNSGNDTMAEAATTALISLGIAEYIAPMNSHWQDEVRESLGGDSKMKKRGRFVETNSILHLADYHIRWMMTSPYIKKGKEAIKRATGYDRGKPRLVL